MTAKHILPADIERTSMQIIEEELKQRGIVVAPENAAVVRRVIHTTADFDYARNLRFTPDAVEKGSQALQNGAAIVTDTNMALAGISKPSLAALGTSAQCFISDAAVAEAAKRAGTTRAVAAMRHAAEVCPGAIFAIGNAPTALLEICDLMQQHLLQPALVIAVPVGFVNVEESKERLFAACTEQNIPCIAAMGRKGGSTVAAAICNALLYTATGRLDPSARGWQG